MLLKLYNHIKSQFESAGIHPAATEARILIKGILGYDRQDILLNPDLKIPTESIENVEETMRLRVGGRPLSKILGENEFWGLPFNVTDDTLDPRQDSETIIEAALKYIPDQSKKIEILDIGTGTGCLIIALLHEYPNATGVGIDVSGEAIAVARENASRNKVSQRLSIKQCGWGDLSRDKKYDMIVSNPPYIDRSDIPKLQREVFEHDPHLALFADDHGLKAYKELCEVVPDILRSGGYLFLEIGSDQAKDVEKLFQKKLTFCAVKQDLASRDRCLIFKKV